MPPNRILAVLAGLFPAVAGATVGTTGTALSSCTNPNRVSGTPPGVVH
jgi:hypothetical protein